MDLFQFTMQQLASYPLRLQEDDSHTVRAYLQHWLQRYQTAGTSSALRAGTHPSQQVPMAAADWGKLVSNVAEFYGVPLPVQGLAGFATIESVEDYVQQQLLQAAA